MANHASAEKRNRQRIVRTVRNRAIRTEFRSLVKQVREAIGSGDVKRAETALLTATSALDSAVSKGVLPRAAASRKISRLAAAVHHVKTPAAG